MIITYTSILNEYDRFKKIISGIIQINSGPVRIHSGPVRTGPDSFRTRPDRSGPVRISKYLRNATSNSRKS